MKHIHNQSIDQGKLNVYLIVKIAFNPHSMDDATLVYYLRLDINAVQLLSHSG